MKYNLAAKFEVPDKKNLGIQEFKNSGIKKQDSTLSGQKAPGTRSTLPGQKTPRTGRKKI